MNKKTRKILFAFVGMLFAAALILVFYYLLTEGKIDLSKQAQPSSKEVEKLLEKNLDNGYPETPTEVVKLYWRYNKCIYNNSVNDKDFDNMLDQLRKLYDDELLALDENSKKNMADNFKKDQKEYAKEKKTISSYIVQKNSTIQTGKIDGKECATVISATMTKKKSDRKQTYEKFLCRKDADGKWKIMGWEQTSDAGEIALLGDS